MNARAAALLFVTLQPVGGAVADEPTANQFVEVARDEVGGHYCSQVVFAPDVGEVVSWGTRTHSKPIRAHETQHFLPGENRWVDAWPRGKEKEWAGNHRQWPGWGICAPTSDFYERDGVSLPRPNSSFHQCCWDSKRNRIVYYVGSSTFEYRPRTREWRLIHAKSELRQPPALLLWGSLCYDPVNDRVVLFGGGGVDRSDGRPHTWALDAKSDTWSPLKLEVEPPPRCNSRMVYDSANEVIVLFGGDGQDRGLADTWVFDVRRSRWEERKPEVSPHPRASHALCFLEGCGKVLLVGGRAFADYRDVGRLSRQAWIYDARANTWTPVAAEVPEYKWGSMESLPGTNEAILVTAHGYDHRRATYRFRFDPTAAPGDHAGVPPGTIARHTERTTDWYDDQPEADRLAREREIATLPANRWVAAKPPKSTKGRTWGTAIFDVDRGVAMKWGGGHSGYQGTDMAFYDVATNRFSIDRAPAFTPDPFERWARRPAGRTFFNQPWARHMRHTCAYDPVAKLGVFTDAGGSEWYVRDRDEVVKHTWLYDPVAREWLEPIEQPFPGGGTRSPIAIPTPKGVLVYQERGYEPAKLYRFVVDGRRGEGARWVEVPLQGDARPPKHEHLVVVYDTKRDRLVFLSEDEAGNARLWFLSMSDRRWRPNPKPAEGGVRTREAVYVPDQDAILAYGPAAEHDTVWTRAYLCRENRWVPLDVETPHGVKVHEVALEYDPLHRVAVLLWPPRFEADLQPHLLRLDVSELVDERR